MRPTQAPYPATRLRRIRQSAATRALTRENTVTVDDFIWPVFVRSGDGIEEPIPSMPGVFRRSVDKVVEAWRAKLPISEFRPCASFPTPALRSGQRIARARGTRTITPTARSGPSKKAVPEIAIMTDVALDTYNINGHDGFVEDGEIVNDRTVDALVKMTLGHRRTPVRISLDLLT